MKKVWPIPVLTVGFAVAGYLLRLWQRRTAFEETGLLTPGAPATWALAGVAAAAAVILLLLARSGPSRYQKGYLGAFAVQKWQIVFYVAAGFFLAAAGLLGLKTGWGASRLRLLLSAAFIPTGVCMGWTGWLGTRRAAGMGRFNWPLVIPGYCACLWLVTSYQGHTANPTVMEYAFLFLGVAAAILATYGVASFAFEKPRPRSTVWFSAMGFILLAVALADKVDLPGEYYVQNFMFRRYSWPPEGFAAVGYMIYMMTQLCVLLYRGGRPAILVPWDPDETAGEETGGDPTTGDDNNG